MVAIALAEAPAAADETPAPAFMKVSVKVTFAWSNHASMQHLTHYRDLQILDDGSETLAQVKQRFADAEGVPVEMVQFMWFDMTIGRCARGGGVPHSHPLPSPVALPPRFLLWSLQSGTSGEPKRKGHQKKKNVRVQCSQ